MILQHGEIPLVSLAQSPLCISLLVTPMLSSAADWLLTLEAPGTRQTLEARQGGPSCQTCALFELMLEAERHRHDYV